jgi:phosphate-selective porin OprO/OprP
MIGGHRTVERRRGVVLGSLVTFAVAFSGLTAAAEDPSSQSAEATAKERVAASSRPWNAFETRWINGRLFGGLALDTVRYVQEEGSEDQLGDLTDYEKPEVRVARLGLAGTINFAKPWSYYISGAYLGFGRGFDRQTDDSWSLFDLRLEIPMGRVGRLTVGKFKEPFSMERLMGGGVMPGIERAMGTDALTPARNVGVQLGNSFAGDRMTWAAGIFNDWAFTGEKFDRAASQVIGRLTGLVMNQPDGGGLLHIGVSGRYSDVKPGFLKFSTTPEVFQFPTVLDTGDFPADTMTHGLVELYYQRGPLWLGGEAFSTWIDSPEAGSPRFSSAWVQGSWIVNGDSRPYLRERGIFGVLQPERAVTEGGVGLFEVGVRLSTVDLEDGAVRGGESSRLTGIANWYLTARTLLAFNYGLIRLDLAGVESTVHTFQLRLFMLF